MDGGVTFVVVMIGKLAVVGGVVIGITTSMEWFHSFSRKAKKPSSREDSSNSESIGERIRNLR